MRKGYVCKHCKEEYYYADEVVFFAGDIEVVVTEASPDYSHVVCHECLEEEL